MDQATIVAWVSALAIGGLIRDLVGRLLTKSQSDVDMAQKAMQTASSALEELSKMRIELDEAHRTIKRLRADVDELTAIVNYYDQTTDI